MSASKTSVEVFEHEGESYLNVHPPQDIAKVGRALIESGYNSSRSEFICDLVTNATGNELYASMVGVAIVSAVYRTDRQPAGVAV